MQTQIIGIEDLIKISFIQNEINQIEILKLTNSNESNKLYSKLIIKSLKNKFDIKNKLIDQFDWDKYIDEELGEYVSIYKSESNLINDSEDKPESYLMNISEDKPEINNFIQTEKLINELKDQIIELKNETSKNNDSIINNLFEQLSQSNINNQNSFQSNFGEIKSQIQQIIDNQKSSKSQELGVIGETEIFEMIKNCFPEYENLLVSKTSHQADIHSIDRTNNILYAYEIKNKLSITSEDLSKFENDLKTISDQQLDLKVIGIFISLHAPVPRIGNLSIKPDKCYLTQEYVNNECFKLVIDMYSNILLKVSKSTEVKNKYEIPEDVLKLISSLKTQYSSLNEEKQMYEEQIKLNQKSSGMMNSLLAKINMKLEFIDAINKQFQSDLELMNEIELNDAKMNKLEEEKLEKYIQETPKSKISKAYITKNFSHIGYTKTMKLSEIIDKFKK